MDLRRELVAAIELDNPSYDDTGLMFWGHNDSVLNEFMRFWGGITEIGRRDVEVQLVEILQTPFASGRDIKLVTMAARLCGRLSLDEAAAYAYSRLQSSTLRQPVTQEAQEARLGLLNLIASLANKMQSGRALVLLTKSGIIPDVCLSIMFQGYMRKNNLSFADAVDQFFSDLGPRAATAPWSQIIEDATPVIDLPVLASTIGDLRYDRISQPESPNANDHTWLLNLLFRSKHSILKIKSDSVGSFESSRVVYSIQRRRGFGDNYDEAPISQPGLDADEKELIRYSYLEKVLRKIDVECFFSDGEINNEDYDLSNVVRLMCGERR